MQLSVMATKAGLFSATSSGCSTLAAVINAHTAATQAQEQQPDQQQQRQSDELEGSGVAALAATLLLSAARIGKSWPGSSGMLSLTLVPAVPALAELAVAVIRSPAAACSYQPSEGFFWDVEASNPLQAAVLFTWCFASSHAVCLARNKEKQPMLEQLEGSAAVGELLLLALGLTAHLRHEQQQGLSPAPAAQQPQQEAQGTAQQQRQQLVVPPYHQQLLKVLGLPGRVSGVAQAAWTQCPPNTVGNMLWNLAGTTLLRPDLALLPNRCNNSSSGSSQQPDQQAATGTGVSAFVPVLLVLVEAMALQPDADQWLAASVNLGVVLQPALDSRLQQQLAKHLLPAVLQQLLPAAKHAAVLRSQPGPAAAESEQKLQMLQVHLPVIADRLTFHAIRTSKGAAAAAAAFAQHTEEYSALLQAALRHSMQHSNRQRVSGHIYCISQLLRITADSTVMEAVSAGRQLLLLLVSLMKAFVNLHEMPSAAASSEAKKSVAASAVRLGAMDCAQTVMSKLADCLSAARQVAVTGTSSNNHSQRQLLVVLLARCLVVVGRLLQAQMEQAAALLAAPVQWDAVGCCWKALGAGDAIVDLLVEELQSLAAMHPAQLPTAALQQLADEHVQPFKAAMFDLQQGVLAPVAAAASAGVEAAAARDFLRSPAAASAAQRLETFGGAVAGLLPLPDCCNYHGCSSASRVSEGKLVSRNSCVCGGCGVARYCSRECQVAHYKGWHKAVCKRLRQQQQQQ